MTLSAELAADPEFQRLIVAKENALQRRCLSASASAVSLAQSDFNDWTTAAGSEPGTPAAVSVSGSELLVFENEELRKQNDGLRAELRKLAAAQKISGTVAQSQNRVYLNAGSLLLNINDAEFDSKIMNTAKGASSL